MIFSTESGTAKGKPESRNGGAQSYDNRNCDPQRIIQKTGVHPHRRHPDIVHRKDPAPHENAAEDKSSWTAIGAGHD
ncbi:hypothetical protein P6U16_25085 (plasmid) [Rhizobium sp. 32-5/1]|uniref:hypothetical protein n=1 Tax=Rhizobium sp. 32-5/1 TaxID=3019602 RepID=UPI00240D16D0|nr:hypothetical protein [Rhizobium sp. 32-5/1]WEZ86123.1 hypothetical protein P6U16_25085 [Rhizobium sp. 32-5/1]